MEILGVVIGALAVAVVVAEAVEVVAAAAFAEDATCPPPESPGTATTTLELLVEMPRSLSIWLTGSPVLLAMDAALTPCWAICMICAIWDNFTVSCTGCGAGVGTDPPVAAELEYVRELVIGEMLKITSLDVES